VPSILAGASVITQPGDVTRFSAPRRWATHARNRGIVRWCIVPTVECAVVALALHDAPLAFFKRLLALGASTALAAAHSQHPETWAILIPTSTPTATVSAV
jgi:hypothetical protein